MFQQHDLIIRESGFDTMTSGDVYLLGYNCSKHPKRPFRLVVRTLPFRGDDTGSNPVRGIIYI